MRVSQFFISTLKEAPAEAELVSHKLMLRAGLIRRLATGIYTWMPLGLRVLRKVENIVREEMNRAGAIEISMPLVQPAELWQETGRWQAYGAELLRFKDRHERDYVIQPTSEEVVTDIARHELRSYKQLPANFYQIQTKFRDERRPRFGVMRGREFVMKDAYSFHADKASLEQTYQAMYDAYTRIFTRLGLQFRAVAADTGSIGGTASHEFQVLAESGEDAIAYCPTSDYAANIELAPALPPTTPRKMPAQEMKKVETPDKKTCEDVSAFLDVTVHDTVKTIAVVVIENEEESGQFALILLRGDHELNEIKTQKLIGAFRLARADEIETALQCRPGYIGPVNVNADISVYADHTVVAMSDFVCGANEEGYHLTSVNFGRDLPEPKQVADFRNIIPGDPSPDGKGVLDIRRGIEVGHVFQLGTKYSQAMNATVLDERGETRVVEMGCYGIGVSRIVAASIEQNFDERGIIWSPAMAPFQLALVPLGYGRSATVKAATDKLYQELINAGIDVLLDDRDERPGVLLADTELLGLPYRIVIGERGLKQGQIEIQARRETAAQPLALDDNIVGEIKRRLS